MTPDHGGGTKAPGATASGPRTVIGVDGGVAVEQLVIGSDDDPHRMTRFDLAPPRHFVFPAVLLLLSEEPSYGYELVKGLRTFRFGTVDRPAVYRALAQLEVSDEITLPVHRAASQALTGVAGILERSRENGPMRDAPLAFVVALANALAEATIDFIIHDPDNADAHGRAGFDALWRMIA